MLLPAPGAAPTTAHPLLHYHLSHCPSAPSSMPRSHPSGCPGPGLEKQRRPRAQHQKTNTGSIVSQQDPCADEPPLSLGSPDSTPQLQPNVLALSGCGQIAAAHPGTGSTPGPERADSAALTHYAIGALSNPIQLLKFLHAPASSQLEQSHITGESALWGSPQRFLTNLPRDTGPR